MVTKEQAREIYNYYSQIETTEKLIADLKRAIEKEKDNPRYPEIIRDNFYHPHGSICITLPFFDNSSGEFTTERGSTVYNIGYMQAVYVLRTHAEQLKRELAKIQPKDDSQTETQETTSVLIPETRRLQTDDEISSYVTGRFFRCVKPFLSWLKENETYWLEYQGNKTFEVRSDNALGQKFEMEVHQLLTCFVPFECEIDFSFAIRYFHWLGELGIHHGDIDDIAERFRFSV